MPAGVDPQTEDQAPPTDAEGPEISACETSPGNVVFIEASNTDGWISSDTTVELQR